MSHADFLTQDELKVLTGATQTSKQSEVLLKHGIFYVHRPDNTIVTTWTWVHRAPGSGHTQDEEPDYGAAAHG